MSTKPELSRAKRRTILRAVRKYCKENNINGPQLSEQTGVSTAACGKMIGNGKTRTRDINCVTAGLMELWLEDRSRTDAVIGINKIIANKKPVNVPSEGNSHAEVTILKLEQEVEEKDRMIRELQTELRVDMEKEDSGVFEEYSYKYHELLELYTAQTKYLAVLLSKYNASV